MWADRSPGFPLFAVCMATLCISAMCYLEEHTANLFLKYCKGTAQNKETVLSTRKITGSNV